MTNAGKYQLAILSQAKQGGENDSSDDPVAVLWR
jgi:hypothetical protein